MTDKVTVHEAITGLTEGGSVIKQAKCAQDESAAMRALESCSQLAQDLSKAMGGLELGDDSSLDAACGSAAEGEDGEGDARRLSLSKRPLGCLPKWSGDTAPQGQA